MTEQKHTGLPVAGYRPQSTMAVDDVNENKRLEELVLQRLDFLDEVSGSGPSETRRHYDRRWLAIARTQIEQGFMAMNRAVFKPARVKL